VKDGFLQDLVNESVRMGEVVFPHFGVDNPPIFLLDSTHQLYYSPTEIFEIRLLIFSFVGSLVHGYL
jgi:hypothetical protein